MSSLLIWWVLPSLICLLLFLQLRHLDGISMAKYGERIVCQEMVGVVFFMILLWPMSVATVLTISVIVILIKIANIVNFSWLYKEWK